MDIASVLKPEIRATLDTAQTDGRIRSWFESGNHIVLVPLQGRNIKAGSARAVDAALTALGSGRGNMAKEAR